MESLNEFIPFFGTKFAYCLSQTNKTKIYSFTSFLTKYFSFSNDQHTTIRQKHKYTYIENKNYIVFNLLIILGIGVVVIYLYNRKAKPSTEKEADDKKKKLNEEGVVNPTLPTIEKVGETPIVEKKSQLSFETKTSSVSPEKSTNNPKTSVQINHITLDKQNPEGSIPKDIPPDKVGSMPPTEEEISDKREAIPKSTENQEKQSIYPDRQSALKAVKENPDNFIHAGEFRDDGIVALHAIHNKAEMFKLIGNKLHTNRSFIVQAVKKNANVFEYLDSWRDDEEIALLAIAENPKMVSCIGDKLKERDFFSKAVQKNGFAFLHIPTEFQDDLDLASEAFNQNQDIWESLNPTMRNSILHKIKQYINIDR